MPDLRGGIPTDWIVCGWSTNDPVYRSLAKHLAASLDEVGAPYNLVEVARRKGGHQANTMAKPHHVLGAMSRHSDKTIVFSDVDCVAVSDVAPLATVSGDFACKLRARRLRTGSVNVAVSSTVFVVKPTVAARRFVEIWRSLSTASFWGDTDQTTLALTLGQNHGCSIGHLDDEVLRVVFRHAAISKRTATRIPGWMRESAYLFQSTARVLFGATRSRS